MKLLHSPSSPYVRKVMVVAHETGLVGRIDPIPTNPWVPEATLLSRNPLGKVPTLMTEEGLVLYDSPVICEYLDSLHQGPRLFPAAGPERWLALRLQALGDGVLDAAVLRRLESLRPAELRSAQWERLQHESVRRALDSLEQEAPEWGPEPSIGQVASACALGYLDFRFPGEDWRAGHGALAAWYAGFAARPSMKQTEFRG